MHDIRRMFHKLQGFATAMVVWLTLLSNSAAAQNWSWTKETIDTSGTATALAVDSGGNVHVSYNAGGLKYGFRPAGRESHWFTMKLGGGVNYTGITTDSKNYAHICSTYLSLPLRYAHFNGKDWVIEEIAPEDNMSVQVQCSVAISPDGTPHLSWYRIPPNDLSYAHMRYAVLKDGVWQMRTLDFDMQTGKWESMVVDSQGNPAISYDAYIKGLLKLARWDGKDWIIRVVDYRGAHGSDYNLGMGSHVMLDAAGNAHISYYTTNEIRYARQEGQNWKIETVDRIVPTGTAADFRSFIVLDKDGRPHISYEDAGVLKHAYWDRQAWRIQVIAPTGQSSSRFNSMAVDPKENILYVAYQDPVDSSLQVVVGRELVPLQTATTKRDNGKN
jgi:hypothetical protein